MFKSLRSRLILSYTAIILFVLVFILAAAVIIGSETALLRYGRTFNELDAISRASRNEVRRMISDQATADDILEVLAETAVENNVRVLIVSTNRQIIFDSGDSWVGTTLDQLLEFETGDPNTIAAFYTRSDNSNWLLYSRALNSSSFGQFLIVYARPEPARLSFLQELGLGRLLLISIGATFVIAILLALGIANSVAKPLREMASAAEQIAEGNYNQQLAIEGPSEVQTVAQNFNSMATQVAATRQAQRDFVANVSHDLKTPITSIQGWSQALVDGTAVSPDQQAQAASVIHEEAERMTRMVQRLLDLAKIESGQLELHKTEVDLAHLVRDVHRNLSVRARDKGVAFTVAALPVPPMLGDRDRLMQIVTNLTDNALAHTPACGTVHLRVAREGETAVSVTVQDSGSGIPQAELDRIFERFYQVDKSRAYLRDSKGTGLGLAIVNELVLLHNGRVSAQSTVGEGSTFRVTFPV